MILTYFEIIGNRKTQKNKRQVFHPFPLSLFALFSVEFSDGLQELFTVGVKRTIRNAL